MSLELVRLEALEPVLELAARVYEDPANREATGWRHEEDKAEAITSLTGLWERRFDEGWSVFRVVEAGRAIGLAGIGPTDDPEDPPGLGVYLLDRGRGLGTEIAARLVDVARAQGAGRMRTVSHAANVASHRMLEKVGFEKVGPCTADWATASGETWWVFELEL